MFAGSKTRSDLGFNWRDLPSVVNGWIWAKYGDPR
jgi:hypothetical protein